MDAPSYAFFPDAQEDSCKERMQNHKTSLIPFQPYMSHQMGIEVALGHACLLTLGAMEWRLLCVLPLYMQSEIIFPNCCKITKLALMAFQSSMIPQMSIEIGLGHKCVVALDAFEGFFSSVSP